MIYLKSPREIEQMRDVNRVVVHVMNLLQEKIVAGVSTLDLDRLAEEAILKLHAKPAFKGYRGYAHTLCISINEEVVHGIPSAKRVLRTGDVVSVDCGALKDGFYGDHAITFAVGKVDNASERLLQVTREALDLGIAEMWPGKRLFDISAAVQEHVEKNGFSVVRDFVGHGVGQNLHEEPQLPNFGKRGTGLRLKPGLVLAIEPMVNVGTHEVETLNDGWTVVTKDRKRSAHFEHSVAITEKGPDVLSQHT